MEMLRNAGIEIMEEGVVSGIPGLQLPPVSMIKFFSIIRNIWFPARMNEWCKAFHL